MTMSKVCFVIAVLLLGAIFSSGCNSFPECGQFDEVFKVAGDRRYEALRHYPPEKQLDIYRCGMKREPPDTGIAWEIANLGSSVVPVLIDRLKATTDETDQQDLIFLFDALAIKGNLKNRWDVIDLIEGIVSNMKDPLRRKSSEELLEDIKLKSDLSYEKR